MTNIEFESKHPRGNPNNAGSFAAKANSTPECGLGTPKAGDPVGYTFKAENYTPAQLVEVLIKNHLASPGARGMSVEDVLDQIAGADGIDRDDEYSYDSDAFPKPIFEDQVTIYEHQLLGRPYYDFGDYDSEPMTAQQALDEWIRTEQIDFSNVTDITGIDNADDARTALYQFTQTPASAEDNLEAIRSGADFLGIDLDALGYPLPTGHNVPERPAGEDEWLRGTSTAE